MAELSLRRVRRDVFHAQAEVAASPVDEEFADLKGCGQGEGVEVAERNEVHEQAVQMLMVEDQPFRILGILDVLGGVGILPHQRLEAGEDVAGEQGIQPFSAELPGLVRGFFRDKRRVGSETAAQFSPVFKTQAAARPEQRDDDRIPETVDLFPPRRIEAAFQRQGLIRLHVRQRQFL